VDEEKTQKVTESRTRWMQDHIDNGFGFGFSTFSECVVCCEAEKKIRNGGHSPTRSGVVACDQTNTPMTVFVQSLAVSPKHAPTTSLSLSPSIKTFDVKIVGQQPPPPPQQQQQQQQAAAALFSSASTRTRAPIAIIL